MSKVYDIDFELSKKLYEQYSDEIVVKDCYNNCFRILSMLGVEFGKGNYRAGYSYIEVAPFGILVRHGIILTKDNKVVDVTAFAQTSITEEQIRNRRYYVFDEMNSEEYFRCIEENDLCTDNPNSKNELKFFKKAKNNTPFCSFADSDFYYYIQPKLVEEFSQRNSAL